MFFPYFKLKQLFLDLYVTCLDRICPDPDSNGTLTSYTIIKNKKYIYTISAIKTNKETNSHLGLYINVDLYVQNNINAIEANKTRLISIEYYYNWTTNYYQKTHSYISPSIKSSWKNPLGFMNKYLITCLKNVISESIKFVDYRMAFNNMEDKFEKHFKAKIKREITEPQKPKKKKPTSKKPRTSRKTQSKPKTVKPTKTTTD